jgi:hypothetical protein
MHYGHDYLGVPMRRGEAAPSIGFGLSRLIGRASAALRGGSRMLRIRSPALGALGAPTPPPAAVGARQPLADQRVADVATVHRNVAQLAAVDVLVAIDARQANSGRLGPPPPFISGVSAQRL